MLLPWVEHKILVRKVFRIRFSAMAGVIVQLKHAGIVELLSSSSSLCTVWAVHGLSFFEPLIKIGICKVCWIDTSTILGFFSWLLIKYFEIQLIFLMILFISSYTFQIATYSSVDLSERRASWTHEGHVCNSLLYSQMVVASDDCAKWLLYHFARTHL